MKERAKTHDTDSRTVVPGHRSGPGEEEGKGGPTLGGRGRLDFGGEHIMQYIDDM